MILLRSLSLTTIQAPIQDFIIEGLAKYLQERLDVPTKFIIDIPWQERERLIDAAEIDLAWICGLPYIVRADRRQSGLNLLAAPVMLGERYQDLPIYFSDVIVRTESRFGSFADLQGATWGFNEPGSQSGHNITRYYLASIDAPEPFFGQVIEAGSHERCIELVVSGELDAAAIDSTVLDLAREQNRRLDSQIRVVEILGPSPIPPLTLTRPIDPALEADIRAMILGMHEDPIGRKLLQRGKIRRFQHVSDSDYDTIRQMHAAAQEISW